MRALKRSQRKTDAFLHEHNIVSIMTPMNVASVVYPECVRLSLALAVDNTKNLKFFFRPTHLDFGGIKRHDHQ